MQINPSHHSEVKNPLHLQNTGHFYKFKNSCEKIQEFILGVFRKFQEEKTSDYEETLNFLLTKPDHEFSQEALEKLFTEITVRGDLAHISRKGPCFILNSYLKEAIIKSHHAFIRMVLQSRGEINLENWLSLHHSSSKDFLKYVSSISFLQNYQDDLLRKAYEEAEKKSV